MAPFDLPFIWPDSHNSAVVGSHPPQLPFESVARSSDKIFGVVSALDRNAVDWMGSYLEDNHEAKLRLLISIHPTCRTTESDLGELLGLVEQYGDRAAFKIFPEKSLRDRSSNLLCLCGPNGQSAICVGPTENMGFDDRLPLPSQANLVIAASAVILEVCRKWFDHLWEISGPLRPDVATTMPRLVVPPGDSEAACLWDDYRKRCLEPMGPKPAVAVDQAVGVTAKAASSPTADIGIPELDEFAKSIARLFDLGSLVSIDKQSRIPPLEAPVKPEWFHVDSFRQTGVVRAQTSIKVAPFDEATLKKIEKLRKISGDLLPRYSFALADGVRWMPKKAIPLFEDALSSANEEAKKQIGEVVGKDVEAFLESQKARIAKDAQRMYEAYHPGVNIPGSTIDTILAELKTRLGKAKGETLIPKVAYSPVAFNPAQNSKWSSPWGQAYQLLKGIAEFPREALTNRFFFQGLHTDEEALVNAMNVAGDHLIKEYGSRKTLQTAALELKFIKNVESASVDTEKKCRCLWDLITAGKQDPVLGPTG